MDTHRPTKHAGPVGAALLVAALTMGGCDALDALLPAEEGKSWGARSGTAEEQEDQDSPEPSGIDDAADEAGDATTGSASVAAEAGETTATDEAPGLVEDEAEVAVDEEGEVFVAQLQMPDRPPEMDRADEDGAAAAAEYFLYAYTFAYGTGDPGPLMMMAGPECGFCTSVADGVAQAHDQGNYMRSPDPVIGAITSAASDAVEIDFLVQIEVQMPQMLNYDSSDQVTGAVPAQDLVATLGLIHTAGHWVVAGAGMEPA